MNTKRFVPQLENIRTNLNDIKMNQEDFNDHIDSLGTDRIKEGSVVKGRIVSISSDSMVVDVGLKNESRIPSSEFQTDSYQSFSIGDIIEVYVEKVAGARGTILSRTKAVVRKSWAKLQGILEKNESITGVIFRKIKGGFAVRLDTSEGGTDSLISFLPASQLDVRPIKDIESIIDTRQTFRILKMDDKMGNIIVSRKAILEEERSDAKEEILSKIKEGDILTGVVKNITDYGAFVDLGSLDGLLHVTDISWNRNNHPSEVLSIGQKIDVMVVKFDKEKRRLSLGMKQLSDNPWKNIKDEIPINQVMNGKISNVADYGGFVEIRDGIEGLVHSSEIAWGKNNQNPKKLLSIGQEVKFLVMDIDVDRHRISLSIKRCQENPLTKFANENPVGTVITGEVRKVTDFGLFVGITEHFDGMIHESDLGSDITNYVKGDNVECKVISIDIENERIALGVKQLSASESKVRLGQFKKNQILTVTVSGITNEGVKVSLNEDIGGFIRRFDLSSDKYEQRSDRFNVGDRIDAKIVFIGKDKISLSVKAFEMDQRNKAIKEYGSTDSGASLGDVLGAALSKEDDNKSNSN